MRIKHLQLKRAVTAVLLVLLLSAMGLTNAMAQSFTVGSFNYSINEDGTTVTLISHVDGQNATGTLTIPASVVYNTFNYPVTAIGSYAFDGCTGLTGDLFVGNAVETIGQDAFYGCSGFTGDLHLGNNVTTVGDYAFYGCSGFSGELIIDHELASVGASAFNNCYNLTGGASVVLTGRIGGSAFYNCTGITSVTIGDAVTAIPSRAFFGCSNLATVTIGEGVTTVAGYSFWNCPSITTVNFNATDCTSMNTTSGNRRYSVFHIDNSNNSPTPIVTLNIGENVTRIPTAAFNNSPNMTGVYFAGSVAQWCGITFESNPLNEGHYLYINGALVTALTIPQGVTAIPDNAFSGGSCITSLNISNSVTSIGASAFYNCTGMVSATIPNSVTDIGTSAFYGCSSLNSVIIPNSVTTISSSTFYGCNSLVSVTLPNSVTTINSSAFYGCSSLASITIPDSVTTIDYYAFNGCSGLSSVTLGNSIESIGYGAFYNCSGLTAVYYTGTLAQWCGITFSSENSNPLYYGHNLYINGALVTNLTIPEGVTAIPNYAFCCGTCINTVNIPSSVTSFGEYAFSNCSGIAVHFSGTIAQWCGITFANNSSNPLKDGALYIDGTLVTNLVIPYGVTVINPYAFCSCTGIIGTLTLPNSLNTIGDYAFQGCAGIIGTLTLPNSLNTIGSYAFQGCTGFTGSLTIPNSVTTIGSETFKNCSGFTGSLTLGTNLNSLTYSTFQGCTGFTIMNYNATDCYFNGYLNFVPFEGMTSLTALNIGSNVQSLAHIKFNGCGSVNSINVLAETPPTITSFTITFEGMSASIPVTVPCGTLSAYQNATGWNSFTNIRDACELLTYSINDDGVSVTVTGHVDGTAATGPLVIPEAKTINGVTYTVTGIGNNAFSGCSGLTGDLVIPNTVTAIGNSAFQSCGGFTGSLTIGNSVTTIGNNAFRNCMGFTGSLVIPDSVTSIGGYTFMNCTGFTGNLIIGNSVTTIGPLAFACQYGGNYSGSLVIPNSVTTIGNGAFMNCSGLTGNLDIPSSITSMSSAFNGCSGFTSITLHWVIPISGSVGSVNYDIPLIVPCGSASLYRYNPNWRNFSDIQEDCSGLYSVSATANPTEGGSVVFRTVGETLLSDSFEEYTVGNTIATEAVAAGHDWWSTWDSNPGGEKDGLVAEYDGSQCGHFTYGNDQILFLGNKESGIYDLEFDVLVPDGKNAYFSILHQFDNGSANEAVKFHLHVTNSYDPDLTPGQGIVTVGYSTRLTYIPCVYDAWMHFRVHIDIDADLARFYYTNSGEEEMFLCQWQWSLGGQSGDGTLAAMDFWPPKDAETSEYYVDNISLKQLGDGTSKGYDANIQIVSEEASNERGAVRTSKYFAPSSICTLTAIPDENYVFTNWTKDGEEVSTEAVYSFIVTEDASFMANFEQSSITQEIFLSQGWNWISTYIEVDNPIAMLQMVETGLGGYGIQIKSSEVNTEYDSEWGWFGDLDDVGMTNEQMYAINVSAPCTVTVEGTPANPSNHPITIVHGWNWIGFPSGVAISLEDAFAGFAQEGDKIKNRVTQIEYDPEWGWFGDFETLEPGQGYMYYSSRNTPRTLVFPVGAK
jgi:hypothetical protein